MFVCLVSSVGLLKKDKGKVEFQKLIFQMRFRHLKTSMCLRTDTNGMENHGSIMYRKMSINTLPENCVRVVQKLIVGNYAKFRYGSGKDIIHLLYQTCTFQNKKYFVKCWIYI